MADHTKERNGVKYWKAHGRPGFFVTKSILTYVNDYYLAHGLLYAAYGSQVLVTPFDMTEEHLIEVLDGSYTLFLARML